MPKTSKVTLGGREYVLTEKVAGVSLKWREKLRQSNVMQLFQSLDGALSQIVEAVQQMGEGVSNGQLAMQAGVTFTTLLPAIMRGLSYSIDDVLDLLFDYAPELGDDKEWLLANAYNDEFIAAFIEVLKLNFPITALWELVTGSKAPAIATNLPSTNGAGHGRKRDLARSKNR